MTQVPQNSPDLMQQMSADVAPEASPFLQWLTDHARTMAIAVVCCLVLAAGYGLYTWQQEKALVAAQEELGRITLIEAAPERISALKALIAKAPEGMRTAAYLELARAAREAKDTDLAITAWDGVALDTKGPFYVIASIAKAEALSSQNKDVEALALMEKMAPTMKDNARVQVDSMIANIAEKMGNIDRAISASEALANNPLVGKDADFWRQKVTALRLTQDATKK